MVKKIWDAFTTLAAILVVVLAILLVGIRIAGFEVFSVLSGSMEPSYHVGSLIYVKETNPEDLKPGDTITFMANETTVVTHRIVEAVPDETDPNTLWFRTKGDANDSEDAALVHCRNVIGRVAFSIPYLGYVAAYIQSPPGLYVALGGGAVLLLLAFLPVGKKEEKST